MPICIECCYPVSHLYSTYSKADDRSLGKGVRLTQCPRCRRFADKYVEHDYVVLFIDLVLIKPQVYRHLLFNRLAREDNKFDRSIIRLGTLILLFDVYLSWARIENSTALATSSLANAPIVVQYLFFLTLNALATLAHHVTVRLLASLLVQRPVTDSACRIGSEENSPTSPSTPIAFPSSTTSQSQSTMSTSTSSPLKHSHPTPSSSCTRAPALADQTLATVTTSLSSRPPPPPPPPPRPPLLRKASTAPIQIQPMSPPSPVGPNAISTALLVSSCTKLFPILLVIWGPEPSDSVRTAKPDNNHRASSPSTTTDIIGKTLTARAAMVSSSFSLTNPPSFSRLSLSSSQNSSILHPLFSLFLSITNTHLVLLNNIEALFILLDCGYVRAMILALGGQLARWVVEKSLLSVAGLG